MCAILFSPSRAILFGFFIRLCVYGMDAVATHFSVGSSQKKQNKRSRFFRPFSFRSFHIRHRVLRRARVPRRWFLVDPCSFFLFFFTVASNPSVDREREREKVIKQKDGARMDPMDVNVEAGSAARWRRLKISRFNGGSSFTWLPNFFWGFFLVFGFVWLFFFFVLVPAPGARGHETNPIVAVDRRFYSVALSLSLSLPPWLLFFNLYVLFVVHQIRWHFEIDLCRKSLVDRNKK